jgi:hypothetical protein
LLKEILKMKRQIWLALAAMFWVTEASAQIVIDGKADATYGTALSVQNTNTQFGNAENGDPINGGGGSEIDQVFGKIENGRLYVTVTGNLEPNFNKLEVFVDSKTGGVNTIDGASLPAAVDAFCCGGFGTTDGALQRMSGLTFDAGFDADYYVTFSNGFESVGPEVSPGQRETQFWAVSGHYAELGEGTAGTVVAAGVQYAHRGLPNVLRFPGDFNDNGSVDTADYTVWRDSFGTTVERGSGADANGDTMVDAADYAIWKNRFGADTSLAGFPFKPTNLADGVSEALVGPNLPGLAQGQLVDSTYALSANGGCNADNSGAGCVAKELEFVLPLDPADTTNARNHRAFTNSVDIELGFDNSNKVGVSGAGPYTDPTTGNPQDVLTGLEFSIPLSQLGDPAGEIKLTIFVNGGGHDFSSNQYAGEGVLFGNIGNLWPNLEVEFAGNQFVTIANPGAGLGSVSGVPEPTSALLAAFGLLLGSVPMRRRG